MAMTFRLAWPRWLFGCGCGHRGLATCHWAGRANGPHQRDPWVLLNLSDSNPGCWILGQHACKQIEECGRHPEWHIVVSSADCKGNLRGVGSTERELAGDHCKEYHAHRPNIHFCASVRLSEVLFGCYIIGASAKF